MTSTLLRDWNCEALLSLPEPIVALHLVPRFKYSNTAQGTNHEVYY